MQPTLRFPEFKDEWSYNLFSNIVTNKSKKFNPPTEEATNDIELDSIEQNTGRLLNTYMSNQFTSQKNIFNKNSVLYSKLRPYLNKYYYSQIDGVCSSEIWVLNSLNKKILSNKFLYYFIQTNRFSSVANKSAGSKMPRADWGLVENIRLYRGTIEEQEKIGEFFSKLDSQIELEEKKLELLDQQKRGYMQKIFSQELRFKDENGNEYPEWKIKRIDDVYTVTRGYVLSKKEIKENIDSEYNYPVYSSQTSNNGLMGYYNKFLYENAITWTTDGANAGRVNFRSEKFYCTNVCGVLLSDEGYSNKCMSEKLNSIAYKYVSKVGNPKLMNNVMSNIKLAFPCLEEQAKISKLLILLDNLIDKQKIKVSQLKHRKQGLIQKMFV